MARVRGQDLCSDRSAGTVAGLRPTRPAGRGEQVAAKALKFCNFHGSYASATQAEATIATYHHPISLRPGKPAQRVRPDDACD